MAPRLDRSKWVPKTQARTLYCLTEKELDGLDHEERTNPRVRSGPPMKLYSKEQLERAALARWGSLAALEAERRRRQERREQRSIASYYKQVAQQGSPGAAGGAEPGRSGDAEGSGQQADGQPASPGSPEQPPQQQAPGASPAAAQPGAAAPSPAAARQLPWLAALPPPIAERVCLVPREPLGLQPAATAQAGQQEQRQGGGEETGGQYVLYWMKTAVRGHENPALDAAAAAARRLGLPLLAASFLLASHPYASVRRYKFVLEGLRDAQRELREQGVPLLIYLEGHSEELSPAEKQRQEEWGRAAAARDPFQPGFGGFHPPAGYQQSAGWQALVRLASRAALVVTEDMPVPPDADALQALAAALPPGVQLAAVDTACLLPMRLVRKCYEKAYAFRSATESQRKQRITRTYVPPAAQQQQQPALSSAVVGPAAVAPAELQGLPPLPPQLAQPGWLGWQPLELAAVPTPQLHQHLVSLLERCPGVDQSVPALTHLVGGSGAGYARWERFRKQGLSVYAARRNNAMQRDGVSRLSAYHHWGMVSPFKVAREAALDRSAGAAKFLDEFLTWREIGFNLCLHRHRDLHSLAALPRWARDTLEQHATDPRPALLPYDQLDSGGSGDAFWDAAQRQLAAAGELHNNVRMTWGKAFLAWAPSPQAALSAALHCNHRWALDGCDPASYAGVLWCFGMYDGPKAAAGTPISGSLAQRSTAAHARRLSPAAYSQLPP